MFNKISKPYPKCSLLHITQMFGVNANEYQPNGHQGIDFAFPNCYGAFLCAVADCVVETIITDKTFDNDFYSGFERGYGIILQDCADVAKKYLYWHCMQVFPVSAGDRVRQGDVIAQIGNSGMCFSNGVLLPLNRGIKGSHLHFEMRIDGNAVNPLPYIDWLLPVNFDAIKSIQQFLKQMVNFIAQKK